MSMKEKIFRFFGITGSVLFLLVSFGIIFWIGQDEQERLAFKERARFLSGKEDLGKEAARVLSAKKMEEAEVLDKALHDIDVLLSSLTLDELPTEEE